MKNNKKSKGNKAKKGTTVTTVTAGTTKKEVKEAKAITARKEVTFKREINKKYGDFAELIRKFISDSEWVVALSEPNGYGENILKEVI